MTLDYFTDPLHEGVEEHSLIFVWEEYQTIVNELSVLKLLLFFVACVQHLQTLCLVRNSRIPNLGHVSELRTFVRRYATLISSPDTVILGYVFRIKLQCDAFIWEQFLRRCRLGQL